MIILQNISHTYVIDGHPLPILKNISFKVHSGEQIAVMGKSGSGKSTLMNILSLMLQPTKGKLYFENECISELSGSQRARVRSKRLGMVFQSPHLIPSLSAEENVALPMFYNGEDKAQSLRKAREVLVDVGLGNRFAHASSQLSGGERQRVAIARAIINTPKILIADEPTGALDENTSEEILTLFQRLSKLHEISLIVVTHDRAVAAHFSRLLMLVDGELQIGQVKN